MTAVTTVHRATERARHAAATATQAQLSSMARWCTARMARWRTTQLKRSLVYGCAAGGLVGLQIVTAAPAAVATVPVTLKIDHMRPIGAALIPSEPAIISTILDEAFPSIRVALPPAFGPLAALAKPGDAEATPSNPDELMNFGAKRAPRWLVETLYKAANVTGVDPVYLMTLADVESSLEPDAKAATSSAEGLFQFIDRTWLEVLHDHGADYGYAAAAASVKMINDDWTVPDESQRSWILGLKRDPYLSALMAGELINDIQRELRNQGERELAEAELYLAHFFGAKAAIEFLKVLDERPDAIAAKLFPKAAKANLGLFSDKAGRKRRSITVAELYDRIDSKIVRRLNRYDPVAQLNVKNRAAVADALSYAPN
jgi:hypothetical protein